MHGKLSSGVADTIDMSVPTWIDVKKKKTERGGWGNVCDGWAACPVCALFYQMTAGMGPSRLLPLNTMSHVSEWWRHSSVNTSAPKQKTHNHICLHCECTPPHSQSDICFILIQCVLFISFLDFFLFFFCCKFESILWKRPWERQICRDTPCIFLEKWHSTCVWCMCEPPSTVQRYQSERLARKLIHSTTNNPHPCMAAFAAVI